jgi:hypothetical protein
MPGLSGSERAYQLAIADVCRADATRAAFFRRDAVFFAIDGVRRLGVVQSSIRIDLNTGEEPHRCSFEIKGGSGFVPQSGQTVSVGHGTSANLLFSGRVLTVRRVAPRAADTRPTYACDAAGWVFDADLGVASAGTAFTSVSAASIVRALVPTSLGFSVATIDDGLGTVGYFARGRFEPTTKTLGRLCRQVGATFVIDHDKSLTVFTSARTLTPLPNTITSSTSLHWNVALMPGDLSRVYTHVDVLGHVQGTLADAEIETGGFYHLPLASASLLGNSFAPYSGSLTGLGDFIEQGEGIGLLVGTEATSAIIRTPDSHMFAGQASVFLDTLRNTNSLTVIATNVNSIRPLAEFSWYRVAGQYVYVGSAVGVYSLTASSVAYTYWMPTSTPGYLSADIRNGAEIAPTWTVIPQGPISTRFLPAGTPVRLWGRVSGNASVSSLVGYGTTAYEWSKVLEDDALNASQILDVATEALARGEKAAHVAVEFESTDRHLDIGVPVFVNISSLAEPSAHSLTATLVAHDVQIGGFGRLTATRGPVRTVRASVVRRPTMWQVLQGE